MNNKEALQIDSSTGTLGLSKTQKCELDLKIDNIISEHRHSRAELLKLSAECISLTTSTQSRAKYLADQGHLKRLWNNLTGKNRSLQSCNMQDLSAAQYSAQKMIVKLAEQNAMTLDIAVAIQNRISWMSRAVLETREEVREVWKALGHLTKDVQNSLSELFERTNTLKRNQDLLFWKETIEDIRFNGSFLSEMPDADKLICIVSDFYKICGGQWDEYRDLIFLRSVLREAGLSQTKTISGNSIFQAVLHRPELKDYIFTTPDLINKKLETPIHSPLVSGITKIDNLLNEDKYIINSIDNMLTVSGVHVEPTDVYLKIASGYLDEVCCLDLNQEIPAFDLALDLLSGMHILSNSLTSIGVDTIEGNRVKIDVIAENLKLNSVNENETNAKLSNIIEHLHSTINKTEHIKSKRVLIYRPNSQRWNDHNKIVWKKQTGDFVEKNMMLAIYNSPLAGMLKSPSDGVLFILSRHMFSGKIDISQEYPLAVLSEKDDNLSSIIEWLNSIMKTGNSPA